VDAGLLPNIITTVAVVVGVGFGMIELRQALRARADVAAAQIVRGVQTQEIRRAVQRVLALPNDVDPAVIRADPTLIADALAIDSACEMWGSLVYERIVELHMLDRMVGGWVRGTWMRLRAWVNAERVDNRSPNVAEWWEWLYDMLMDSPDPGKAAGAHSSYKGRLRR
jgi:hypothetical protein